VEVGRIYEGKVAKLMDFGAFVTILRAATAWCTSRRSPTTPLERVADKLREGDVIRVKVRRSIVRVACACRCATSSNRKP